MFSPMSSFIFYPAITSLATSLNVTVGLINLAITTYMVVSGITPAILGNAADKIGRRPVYILALTLYLLANIGLAQQSNFAALLHVAIPLALQAVTGFSTSASFVALGTLLTDLNPDGPSTAAASANIVRCALAAASLAALQPIIDSVGAGWCFTIFGLLCSLCGPMLLLEMRMGHRWRRARWAAK
ncbi:hypothetical protein DL768_003557 [Monosporascus sp. mg162]|nr:hypothetical protein DL768_003557 [Monosporascus sp. mg162]